MDATQISDSNCLELVELQAKSIPRSSVLYFFTGVMALVGAMVVLGVWDWGMIRYPFQYGDDAVWMAMLTKTVIETGWYLSNMQVGAPGGFSLVDFPLVDGLSFVMLKGLALFSSDWAVVNNLFFLLTFPLCAMSALFVMKRMGLWTPFAVAGSVLFALLPYHFYRGEEHLFLSAYYMIPFVIWLAMGLFTGELSWKWGHGVICLVLGSTGIYYAFYGAFLLLVAGAVASFRAKALRSLGVATLFVSLILGSVFLNVLPSVINRVQNGSNGVVAQRGVHESEVYGLKIVQLLLPVKGDRVKGFSSVAKRYNHSGAKVNENRFASLGMIGSAGFLALIFFAVGRRKKGDDSVMEALSSLNLSAVLFATTGGFSALFALLVTPSIRCHNRMSVFIAFFSLAAFFILFQRMLSRKGRGRQAAWSCGMLLLIFGVWNQTSPSFALENQKRSVREEFEREREFIGRVDHALPEGSLIFQLPYVDFPEGGAGGKMGDYDHCKAVLHSRRQRWSFGAMKGRETAEWQKGVAALPVGLMLEQLAGKGFKGLYVNRLGYVDRGRAVEAEVTEILAMSPMESGNELFWNLQPFVEKMNER